jgi:hypothetical protein
MTRLLRPAMFNTDLPGSEVSSTQAAAPIRRWPRPSQLRRRHLELAQRYGGTLSPHDPWAAP